MDNKQLTESLTNKVNDIKEFIDDHLMNDTDTFQEASNKSYIYDALDHLQKQIDSLIVHK